ncbi:hypothetical protein VDGL01_03339 [Verticillium dahliae]
MLQQGRARHGQQHRPLPEKPNAQDGERAAGRASLDDLTPSQDDTKRATIDDGCRDNRRQRRETSRRDGKEGRGGRELGEEEEEGDGSPTPREFDTETQIGEGAAQQPGQRIRLEVSRALECVGDPGGRTKVSLAAEVGREGVLAVLSACLPARGTPSLSLSLPTARLRDT